MTWSFSHGIYNLYTEPSDSKNWNKSSEEKECDSLRSWTDLDCKGVGGDFLGSCRDLKDQELAGGGEW